MKKNKLYCLLLGGALFSCSDLKQDLPRSNYSNMEAGSSSVDKSFSWFTTYHSGILEQAVVKYRPFNSPEFGEVIQIEGEDEKSTSFSDEIWNKYVRIFNMVRSLSSSGRGLNLFFNERQKELFDYVSKMIRKKTNGGILEGDLEEPDEYISNPKGLRMMELFGNNQLDQDMLNILFDPFIHQLIELHSKGLLVLHFPQEFITTLNKLPVLTNVDFHTIKQNKNISEPTKNAALRIYGALNYISEILPYNDKGENGLLDENLKDCIKKLRSNFEVHNLGMLNLTKIKGLNFYNGPDVTNYEDEIIDAIGSFDFKKTSEDKKIIRVGINKLFDAIKNYEDSFSLEPNSSSLANPVASSSNATYPIASTSTSKASKRKATLTPLDRQKPASRTDKGKGKAKAAAAAEEESLFDYTNWK